MFSWSLLWKENTNMLSWIGKYCKKDLIEMASASSDSVSVDDIKDLLTCTLCSESLIEPRSLPCLHNFCKVCLGEYIFFSESAFP